eukprot:6891403-Pyramimonas_sp.AAC.1
MFTDAETLVRHHYRRFRRRKGELHEGQDATVLARLTKSSKCASKRKYASDNPRAFGHPRRKPSVAKTPEPRWAAARYTVDDLPDPAKLHSAARWAQRHPRRHQGEE